MSTISKEIELMEKYSIYEGGIIHWNNCLLRRADITCTTCDYYNDNVDQLNKLIARGN